MMEIVTENWQENTVYSEEGTVIRHLSQSFFQIQYKYFVKNDQIIKLKIADK